MYEIADWGISLCHSLWKVNKKVVDIYPYPICINEMWCSTFATTMVADQTQYIPQIRNKKRRQTWTKFCYSFSCYKALNNL